MDKLLNYNNHVTFDDPEMPDFSVPQLKKNSERDRKVRVLYIITQLCLGGGTNVAIDLASYFNNHPHYDVRLIAGPVSKDRNDISHIAHEHGVKTTIIPSLDNKINPIVNAKAFIDIKRIIVHGNYDIVHTHTKIAGVVGRLAARTTKTPIIVHHIHGWGSSEGMSTGVNMLHLGLERICGIFTDRIIVVSKPDIQKGLTNHIGQVNKYALIYNGIDLDEFQKPVDEQQLRSDLDLDQDSKLIGMIGRLEEQKNPMDFIKAAYHVTKKYKKVQFIMVGGGHLRLDCERLIKELNLEKNFFLLGFRDDVPKILSILSMTVMSSLWEGLPIAFLESMSAGKPIIANNVDGAKDVVIDGETGFLVTPHQPIEMAEKILYLLNNETECEMMGKIAQERSKDFSKQRMFGNVESLYEDLLSDLKTEAKNSKMIIPT